MGKKKTDDAESDAGSADPDIFKILFGDFTSHAAAAATATAIFSESNPFRRKNREPGLGFVALSVEATGNINGNNGELKKRKRKKEKMDSGLVDEEASETPLEKKKSKKKQLQEKPNSENPNFNDETSELGLGSKGSKRKKIPDTGFDSNMTLEGSEEGSPHLGVGSEAGDGMNAAKKVDGKKRKRDEVEREYEAKKYGVEEGEEDGDKVVVVVAKVVGEKRKTVDNPADMLVSNEGFDDESKLLRTVFVGNLPLKVKKKVLIKEFSKFGEVESVRIRSVPILDTKRPRKGAILTKQIHDKADSVNAYIVFKAEVSAQASLSHNMAVVEGHHIRVDRACPPRKKLKGESATVYDHMRTVFVGNLPFDVKDEEVYQLFCGINNMESKVEAIRIIRDPNYGIGKGIAYVLFKTREAANLVAKKRNLKLGDRELRLSHAKPDSTPSKRKSPSSALKDDSPAKKLAVGSRTPNSYKGNPNATKSYQGLRAGKPRVQKKFHSKVSRPDKLESRSESGVKPKERKDKRPSVAARKAKATFQGGSASKQAGTKRKMDSQTGESSQQKKKFKKFR